MTNNVDNKLSKLGKYSFYMLLIYVLGMTGLYFHMDSRIKAQYTIITKSLDLFKSYSAMNTRQQSEINDVKKSIDDLQDQVEDMQGSISDKFDNLYRLIISNKAYAAEPEKDIKDK